VCFVLKRRPDRAQSFLIVGLIYLLAAALGILLFKALPFAPWLSLLIADVAATAFVFVFSLIFGNASVYDPYWSVQPIVIAAAACAFCGLSPLGLLLLIAICVWGVRLTANWVYTFRGLEHQDWRYTMLREKNGAFYPAVNFFGIHLFPTLVVYLCMLPAVFAIRENPAFNPLCAVFFVTALLSAALQLAADIQMQRFRASGSGGLIRTGLWRYARHPNYLGEITMWWSVGLMAVCAMPERWYLLAGALVNTLMFLFASIPMAEKRQSRKPGYTEYKAATRMLLPIKK